MRGLGGAGCLGEAPGMDAFPFRGTDDFLVRNMDDFCGMGSDGLLVRGTDAFLVGGTELPGSAPGRQYSIIVPLQTTMKIDWCSIQKERAMAAVEPG